MSNNFHKNPLLYDGVVAEFVVMDVLHANELLVTKGLNLTDCVDLNNKPSYPTSNAHHDLDLNIYLCDTGQLMDTKSIEVKQANNKKGYTTFYAEITQLKSQTYAEYLVFPPDYMVYVDSYNKIAYFYDGNKFVDEVKKNYGRRKNNYINTADGVVFGQQSSDFGYLFRFPCKQNYFNVLRTKKNEITTRLKASKGVKVNGFKKCKGLPDLH